tara:strand:+ start:459 stop:716 length:258 start_codon:yes stop_codon:yes gene_type:complete
MKIKNFNVLKAFKKVYGDNVELNNTFNDLNPFRQISTTNDDSMLAKNVKKFIDDKKANIEHKKKEDQMVKNWQEEIEINKGVNNE